jgi:hypothetical protein
MEYYVGLDVSLKQIQAEGIEHTAVVGVPPGKTIPM